MIGIIICCCHKYHKQYEIISKIWNNYSDKYKLFYVFGSVKKIFEVNKNFYDGTTYKLFLNVDDTYEALPKKIYETVNFIYNNYPDITGIYKTDDDINCDIDNLLKEIEIVDKNNIDYAGLKIERINKGGLVSNTKLAKFSTSIRGASYDKAKYCYGAGYYLSKKSMEIVAGNKEYFYKNFLEDVAIGYVLNDRGINPIPINIQYTESLR